MLLFQDKPDKIFTEILRVALEAAIEIVKFKEDDKDGEYYKVVFPNASKNFSRELALYVLEDLQGYSEDSNLWKMTDYHLVLIYDVLKHYCIPASENARDIALQAGVYYAKNNHARIAGRIATGTGVTVLSSAALTPLAGGTLGLTLNTMAMYGNAANAVNSGVNTVEGVVNSIISGE